MGIAKNQAQEKRDANKKGKRGSTNNKSRLDAFKKGSGHTGADWGGCDPAKLQGVIVGITELGGAVIFGLSRDRGAHLLTLLLDEQKETLWFNGDAELSDELEHVMGTLEAMV